MEACRGVVVPVWARHSEIDCTIPLTNNWRSVPQDAAGRITSDHGLQKRDTGSGSGEGWSAMMLKNMIWGGFGVKFFV